MHRYAILQNGTNDVLSIVVWDGISVWRTMEGTTALILPSDSPVQVGWRYLPATNSFLKTGSSDPTTPVRRMEKIDFMRLFTTDEMVRYKMLRMQIDALTPADYQAAMAGDALKMVLVQADVYFDRFDLASQLEMDHVETIQGVNMLAQAGIFGVPGENGATAESIAERVELVLAGLQPTPYVPPETPVDPEGGV